jgi:murein DD-endopeptidase MepM/ murein hydrolase activator NlpD
VLTALPLAAILAVTVFAQESPTLQPSETRSELPTSGVHLLPIPAQAPMTASRVGDVSAQLSLPWATGQNWKLVAGPHNFHPGRTTRLSSLDLAGGNGIVRAARGGVVHRDCANFVRISHGDNWHTSYYHLVDIQVSSGQRVQRGDVLGRISQATGCGGEGGGIDHVHFTLWRFSGTFNMSDNSQQYPLDGVSIGGWTMQKGNQPRAGCMIRRATVQSSGPLKKCRGKKIDGRVVPIRVWTADGNGNKKTVFAPGDAIQYTTWLLNPASTKPTLRLRFEAWRSGGQEPDIFNQTFSVAVPPGEPAYYTPSTIPGNAPAGDISCS